LREDRNSGSRKGGEHKMLLHVPQQFPLK
jgi:hypothetical protein